MIKLWESLVLHAKGMAKSYSAIVKHTVANTFILLLGLTTESD